MIPLGMTGLVWVGEDGSINAILKIALEGAHIFRSG